MIKNIEFTDTDGLGKLGIVDCSVTFKVKHSKSQFEL